LLNIKKDGKVEEKNEKNVNNNEKFKANKSS